MNTEPRLPWAERPLVSVVMVTYGAYELARKAIEALAAHTESPFELIVVDNSSPDQAGERLGREVSGARVLLNDRNVGFGAAANQGAEAARGRFVCHLNSDTLVEPRWLPPLLEVLQADARAGAVVPMIMNPDGTVQEAGSVLDSMGWALALGSGDDPGRLEHRFRREIDFGSAACMLLWRDVFLAVGGFDTEFGVGYYEDVDLCFRLRERGLRTVYEPRSRVVHFRFGSSGSELASDLVRQNRVEFYSRWRRRLESRPPLMELPSSPHRLVAARDAEAFERVLVIDDRVPHTDRGSGDPRMAKIVLELADLWPGGRVTLFAADCRDATLYAEPLLAGGVEVACAEGDYARWFESRMFHYSIVIVSRPQNFERFDGLLRNTQPQALRVFDVEALSSRRLALAAGYASDGGRASILYQESLRTRRLESDAVRAADAVFCVTEEERELVTALAPETPTFLLSTYVDTVERLPSFEERRDLVFFGGFLGGVGSPNEDALLHLAADVLPLIRRELPKVVLRVVGADPPPAVRALHGEGIEVVGFVENPAEWLAQARVHVNPLRYGAGIKLKLIDSMAAGLPFVTTGVGAEGLALGAIEPDLVANDPAALANLAVRLYLDREAWEQAHECVLDLARTRFDRPHFRATMVEAMSSLGFAPPVRRAAAGRPPQILAADT